MLPQRRQGCAAHEIRPLEIDVHYLVKHRLCHLVDGTLHVDARGIDEHVEPSERADACRGEPLRVGNARDICRIETHARPHICGQRAQRRRAARRVPARDQHTVPRRREALRRRESDARRAARDEHGSSLLLSLQGFLPFSLHRACTVARPYLLCSRKQKRRPCLFARPPSDEAYKSSGTPLLPCVRSVSAVQQLMRSQHPSASCQP